MANLFLYVGVTAECDLLAPLKLKCLLSLDFISFQLLEKPLLLEKESIILYTIVGEQFRYLDLNAYCFSYQFIYKKEEQRMEKQLITESECDNRRKHHGLLVVPDQCRLFFIC